MGLSETMDSAGTLGGPDAETVLAASQALVEGGMLPMPTDRVTPDVRRALQAVADRKSPGLYDVINDDDDLAEVLEGVANGSFGVGTVAAIQ